MFNHDWRALSHVVCGVGVLDAGVNVRLVPMRSCAVIVTASALFAVPVRPLSTHPRTECRRRRCESAGTHTAASWFGNVDPELKGGQE